MGRRSVSMTHAENPPICFHVGFSKIDEVCDSSLQTTMPRLVAVSTKQPRSSCKSDQAVKFPCKQVQPRHQRIKSTPSTILICICVYKLTNGKQMRRLASNQASNRSRQRKHGANKQGENNTGRTAETNPIIKQLSSSDPPTKQPRNKATKQQRSTAIMQ